MCVYKAYTVYKTYNIAYGLYFSQVTWLEGHSLAQTVFTNLYFHSPLQIENRFLKAFSICMLKTVDVIRERINRAGVFEEVMSFSSPV